ncbi:MAG: hypothetical protein IID32_10530 [Planctomycetes bacterium]|nr:hypothetical protein [Planctomycetota bacterium]
MLELEGAEGLEADAMWVPHHGRVTDNLREFVEAVDPRWLLNSSGRLTERQLERLGETLPGRDVSHTLQTGALMLRFTNEGGSLKPFLSN